jgi:hypothetical protein
MLAVAGITVSVLLLLFFSNASDMVFSITVAGFSGEGVLLPSLHNLQI